MIKQTCVFILCIQYVFILHHIGKSSAIISAIIIAIMIFCLATWRAMIHLCYICQQKSKPCVILYSALNIRLYFVKRMKQNCK